MDLELPSHTEATVQFLLGSFACCDMSKFGLGHSENCYRSHSHYADSRQPLWYPCGFH